MRCLAKMSMAADQLAEDKARCTGEELKSSFRAFASSVGMYGGVAGCGGPAGYAGAAMELSLGCWIRT